MNNGPGNKKKKWEKLLSPRPWRRITSVLMAIVVFLTTYMMILPALTIDLDTVLDEPGMYVASEDLKSEEPAAAGSSSGDIGELLTDDSATATNTAQTEFANSEVSESIEEDSGNLQEDPETAEYIEEEVLPEDTAVIPSDFDANVTEGETNYYEEVIPELTGSEEDSFSEEQGEEPLPYDELEETEAETSFADQEVETEVLPSEEQETIEDATEQAELFTGEPDNDDDTALVHVLKAEGTDYRVNVSYTNDAEIPEGAELRVTEILSDENDYDRYVNEAANALSTEERIMSVDNARFFDITILDGEVPVEPKVPVTVVVELADSFAASDDAAVLHYKEDEVLVVDTVDPVEAAANIAAGEETEAVLSAGEVIGQEEPVTVSEEIYEETPEETTVNNEETYELTPEETVTAYEEPYGMTPEVPVTASEANYGMAEDISMLPEEFEAVENEAAVAFETAEKTEEFTLDETMNPIAFVADSFSVYGFVTTTLEKAILASNGHNYTVTMTYGADADIPEGVELHAEEVAEDAEMPDGTKYADAAAEALGIEETESVKTGLFDIYLTVGEEKIQPKAPVHVTIALDDAKEAEETVVVHFGEAGPEVPEQSAEEGNVSFETDGFSMYAVLYTKDAKSEVNGKIGVTNTENVGVYSGHNLVGNTQIDTIEAKGTRVTLLGLESGILISSWYKITYVKNGESITGYVEKKYIDIPEMAEPVTGENDAFKVTASWAKGVLPEGTVLESGETSLTEEERKDLENKALTVLPVSSGKKLKVTGIRFFDLSFMADGVEIEPDGEVNVSMQLKQTIATEADESLRLVHFTGGTTELLENADFTKDENGNLTALDFTVGSFSTFAIVKTIETTVLASNGVTYDVTVYYTEEANIPAGSTLRVTEFAEGSEEYDYARRAVLADKKEKNEAVNPSEFGFAALDISILNPDESEIEPNARVYVDLKIKSLPGVENLEDVKGTLEIQHHVETGDGVVVEKVYNGSDNASYKVETDDVIISNGLVVDPDSVTDEDFYIPVEEYVDTEFPTDFFSTYSVTWSYNWDDYASTVHYGYMESGSFKEFPQGTPAGIDYSAAYNYLIYDVEGYKYSSTHLGSPSGTQMQPMLYHDSGWGWSRYRYYDMNGNLKEINKGNIYVIYDRESSPTSGGTPAVPDELTWPDQDTPSSKPEFSKSSINNGDDTNTITLSVKAPEKDVANFPKANVIVVLDLSASMSDYMDGQTRLSRAKKAVNDMAETLLDKNGVDGSSLVKMSLITFGAEVVVEQSFTDNKTTYKSTVNGLSAYSSNEYKGGTNWEGALYEANRMANAEGDEDAATFVIFVTDGDPTFRISRGELTDEQLSTEQTVGRNYVYRGHQLFGYGTTTDGHNGDRYEQNFDFAVEQVKQIAAENKYFYAIGISNDVTKAEKLCSDAGIPAGHAFLGSDSAGLTDAFDAVVESISATLGFGDLQIKDGITALTNLKMKVLQNADPGSIKYYRYGGKDNKYGADEAHRTEWTTREADGCDAASYNPATGSMEWNMGELFQLEDDVTYQISFRVWPSQTAYDLVADLNNGTREFNELDSFERDQIVPTGTDSQTGKETYALKTNTDTVMATYKHTTLTGDVVSTAGETEYEAEYKEGIIENMNLKSEKLYVKKDWEHGINESHSANSVNFRLLVDGEYYQENGGAGSQEASAQIIPVNDTTSPKWENSIFIATGIMDYDENTGEMDILEEGHDYVLDEYQLYEGDSLSEYAESYEFESQTVHPMRINGVLTYLILYEEDSEVPAGSKTYVLNGKKYYASTGSTGILSGTNYRKAELDITKLINNNSVLTEADLDKETFTYRVTLEVPKDADVSLITAYEFVKRTDGKLYYIDGYKIGESPISGDEVRFSEETYRWYTVAYGTNTPIGEGFAPSGDGKHKTITMDITLNRNEVLRFTNLPTGTKYTIQEYYANYRQASPSRDVDAPGSTASSNLEAQGYSVTKIVSKPTGGSQKEITGADSIDGTISDPNKRYYNQFTNTLGNVADAEISVTKHLEDYSWSGEKYYFKLTPDDPENPMPLKDTLWLSSPSGTDDKTYSFGKIRFTEAGTYTYTVSETDENGALLSGTMSDSGIVYGETERVTVTVGTVNGKLAITGITDSKGEDISESVEGSAVIKGSAVITNSLNEIQIKKLDSETKKVINGAVFELYQGRKKLYFDENMRVLTPEQVKIIIEMEVNAEGADKKMKEAGITSSFTIGETKLKGLSLNTDYVLKEKNAPAGYAITANDCEFKLVKDNDTDRISTVLKEDQDSISLDDSGMTIMVENTPGACLPSTGGPGTNLLYLLGTMLSGFAGAGLMTRKRRRNAA